MIVSHAAIYQDELNYSNKAFYYESYVSVPSKMLNINFIS